jgi:hypothetical protein
MKKARITMTNRLHHHCLCLLVSILMLESAPAMAVESSLLANEADTVTYSYRPGWWPWYYKRTPVPELPDRANIVELGHTRYYYADGMFFRTWKDGYVQVEAPIGASVPRIPDNATRHGAQGSYYYQFGHTWFAWDSDRHQWTVIPYPG